jgi:hypothetical protein
MTSVNLSRRAIVAGAASVPAFALPAVALASTEPDPIFAAVAEHRYWDKRLKRTLSRVWKATARG